MVTTDEDNVVRGTISESDRFGNIKTFVEVGVERVDAMVTGSNARRGSTLWPLFLISIVFISLMLVEFDLHAFLLVGGVALLFLASWVVGATR